ncbi:MAG TPA: serine protease [bacterium]|nr:serine protease [bacterium]
MGRGSVLFVLVLALITPAAAGGGRSPDAADPAGAVFQVEIVARDTNKSAGYGTAFFTASDGTALTASHVVYRAQHDPEHYDLLAIVDKEFYSVEIVCASKLHDDPTKPSAVTGVQPGRDVAQIKVVPSRFLFREWLLTLETGEKLRLATAHANAVPAFPYLAIARGPSAGEHIRVIGFGHISPIPRVFVATGQIDRMTQARDGTDIFSAEFPSRPQPGNSGSPILNDRNQVVGLWPWYSLTQSNLAVGISSTALQRPCP